LDPFTAVERITHGRLVAEPWLPAGLSWVVWAALGLGVLLAALSFLPAVKMGLRTRIYCFLLRLGMVALLILVLLRAHLQLNLEMGRQPAWLAVVDDSGSMGTKDVRGGARFQAATADLEAVREKAGRRVALDTATLSGAPLGREAGEKTDSHIHDAILRELAERPRLQRLLLLTDGRDVGEPDYTLTAEALKSRGVALDIALYGSEQPMPASALRAAPERSVIRLGESVAIRGSLTDAAGKASREVKLLEDGKPVRTVSIASDSYGRFDLLYRPEKAGVHRYTLTLDAQGPDRQTAACSFFVEIRDEKINVLVVEGLPGYEFKLLKAAMSTDPLVHLVTVSHLPGGGIYVQGGALHANAADGVIAQATELYKYDIVMLLDVPRDLFRAGNDTNEVPLRLLGPFVQKRGGGLVVMGGQQVYRAGGYQDSPLAPLLPFDLTDSVSKSPQFPGKFNVNVVNNLHEHPLLRLLPDAAANREMWNALPRLDGCNNVGLVRPMARPLLARNVEIQLPNGLKEIREVPVLACLDFGDGKIVASSVDTFGRWQLQPEFDPPPLETLMGNLVRYLAPEAGSRAGNLNIVPADPTPALGQTVVLSTFLRDKNYDPVRSAELKVVVTKPDRQTLTIYPCDLPERPGYYEYRFPADQAGDWSAKLHKGKEQLTTRFVVRGGDDEYAELAADRAAMKTLAKAAGGTVVESVPDWLKGVDLRPASEPVTRDLELWNSPAVLVLFILLVCVDCYLRKRQGLA
jgi:hypothetical protein